MIRIMVRWRLMRLKSEKDKTRERAIKGLGRSRNVRSVRPLMDMLDDERDYIRESSAAALGMIGDTQAIPRLEEKSNDESELVRLCASRTRLITIF